MLSKCANPNCSEQFQYLHQGKLFCLSPTPQVEAMHDGSRELLYERFWLCDFCCKEMKVVWDGYRAKIVRLPIEPAVAEPAPEEDSEKEPLRRHAALASRGVR